MQCNAQFSLLGAAVLILCIASYSAYPEDVEEVNNGTWSETEKRLLQTNSSSNATYTRSGPRNQASDASLSRQIEKYAEITHQKIASLRNMLLDQYNWISKTLQNILIRVVSIETVMKPKTLPESLGSICERGMLRQNARQKFLLWNTIPALCDTETDGGGWVIIQRRTTGDVSFHRGWSDYKYGFGTPETDLWIGNEIIHNLTTQGYNELQIELTYPPFSYNVHYTDFRVSAEQMEYSLSLGVYSGNLSDSFRDSDRRGFVTFDRGAGNCNTRVRGGWWLNICEQTNLNGIWGATNGSGIVWYFSEHYFWGPFTKSEMKIRRK